MSVKAFEQFHDLQSEIASLKAQLATRDLRISDLERIKQPDILWSLKNLSEQFSWFSNVFGGFGTDAECEFHHWWRVEAPTQLKNIIDQLSSSNKKPTTKGIK